MGQSMILKWLSKKTEITFHTSIIMLMKADIEKGDKKIAVFLLL